MKRSIQKQKVKNEIRKLNKSALLDEDSENEDDEIKLGEYFHK